MKLTINEKEYMFRFTIGFLSMLRDTKTVTTEGVTAGIGDTMNINMLVNSRDVVALRDILLTANRANGGKLTPALLDDYLDNESTDIEALTDEVIAELSKANATASKVKSALATAAN